MKNGPNKSMREALLALSNDGDTVAAISRMLKAMEPNTSELHRLEEAYREAGLVPPKAFRGGFKTGGLSRGDNERDFRSS